MILTLSISDEASSIVLFMQLLKRMLSDKSFKPAQQEKKCRLLSKLIIYEFIKFSSASEKQKQTVIKWKDVFLFFNLMFCKKDSD